MFKNYLENGFSFIREEISKIKIDKNGMKVKSKNEIKQKDFDSMKSACIPEPLVESLPVMVRIGFILQRNKKNPKRQNSVPVLTNKYPDTANVQDRKYLESGD